MQIRDIYEACKYVTYMRRDIYEDYRSAHTPHTHTYVSSYCYQCVLMLLPMCPDADIHVSEHARSVTSYRHASAYVSIRRHTPADVSIRQHTSAYVRTHVMTSRILCYYMCALFVLMTLHVCIILNVCIIYLRGALDVSAHEVMTRQRESLRPS